ncbi:type II toxin-antitoxin system RelE/ParE family toxin [Fulvivirga sp. M361]|uniref:type II toxin-antitoxin system RelE/ParE family toxin n=1 Tax=Fulvivirga sp. M361 TaxID=2594266 RepID=UPI001179CB92|nr:type II toxin-antitoxin system RelE/ParE family toxin [Fulvivirga sp. M361]TRX61419.1 type II toxin-antitoxin system RelE/ParE family toxin [Fulvivirga sp. M361]
MAYSIIIEPAALQDIQQAIDYYDEQQVGLGERFEAALNKHLVSLEENPFFQIRYDDVHCQPLKKYPYMIHFTINEENKTATIQAVFHTSLDPGKWKDR